MKSTAILSIICAALVLALGWTCTVFYERMEAQKSHTLLLEEKLATAQSSAERWRVTATALQGRVDGQSVLAQACLKREAELWQDVATREAGMALSPPVIIAEQHQTLGVSRETRSAFVNYYNQSLD